MFDFPTTPAIGTIVQVPDGSWRRWDGVKWGPAPGPGPQTLQAFIGDAPPGNPLHGELWFDSYGQQMYIWYDDPNSSEWVVVTANVGGISADAPYDGQFYARQNAQWAAFTPFASDAPGDGQFYARQNAQWAVVAPITADAPSDGQVYGRQSGAWANIAPGGPYLPLIGGTLVGPLIYTATGGNTPRAAQDRVADPISVLDFGAKCDGTTDDTAAVNAALTSGVPTITIPAGKCCYLPNGITVPLGVTLRGLSFHPDNPPASPPSSSILTNANINSVTLNGPSTATHGATLSNLVVMTNATARPTAGAGVYVNGGYGALIDHVLVYNCYDGFYFKAQGSAGIAGYLQACFTGLIGGHHLVQDTWPEIRCTMCRFGQNGGNSIGALAYVYVTGGLATNLSLPNTLYFTNCQFNESNPAALVGAAVLIGGLLSGSGASPAEISFSSCHIEACSTFVQTDSTCTQFNNLSFVNCFLIRQNASFWALDPATTHAQALQIVGCNINVATFNLSCGFFESAIMGNNIRGATTITSTDANSTLVFSNNGIVSSNLTISGPWAALSLLGLSMRGGTYSNTATGNVSVFSPTPAITGPGTFNALTVNGTSTMAGNVNLTASNLTFNNRTGASTTDLSNHVQLYNGYGMNVTSSRLNYSIASSAGSHFFIVNNTDIAQINASGLTMNANIMSASGGVTIANRAAAGGVTDLSNHFQLYTGCGFNITSARVNYNAASANSHVFVVNGVDVASINATTGITVGASGAPNIRAGAGAATGTQPAGSLWLRTDGAAGTRLYVSQGGGTWTAVAGV